VRFFYEGLLRLALAHPIKRAEDGEEIPSKMIAYNRFKSPIIEAYLKGEPSNNDEYAIRQVHVKHILRIEPDYNVIMFNEEEVAYVDSSELYDKQGNSIQMEELEAWSKEVRTAVISSNVGKTYAKDWADYHRRGLELAHKLRDILSTDFDLWYAAPFEDKSGTIPQPHLII